MNAHTRFVAARNKLSDNGHEKAALWRGRFVEEFAAAETEVSEALAFLSKVAIGGRESLLPHLMSQRFEALRIVVGPRGPLAAPGSRVARALSDFDEFHAMRSYLCHGYINVTVDEQGKWSADLQLVTFRSAKVERSAMHVTEDDAALLLDRLRSARIRLAGQLRGMLAWFNWSPDRYNGPNGG